MRFRYPDCKSVCRLRAFGKRDGELEGRRIIEFPARRGEIPRAPLGLIQSSRGQYCWWDRRSVFGEISQILSNISFTREKNSPIPVTLALARGRGEEFPSPIMLSIEPVHHSPENSTFRDLKLPRLSTRSRCRLTR